MMKAIIWTAYGPPEVLQLEEVDIPQLKEDQILVRVLAASVTAGDCEIRRLSLPLGLSFPIRLYAGLVKPKRIPILGQEFAGEVAKVSNKVTAFKAGDQVYGTTGFGFGAYAEYLCLPAEPKDAQGVINHSPVNLTPEETAVVPTAGLEALHYLREGRVGTGSKVLVIGGGGSIGTISIQLAKHLGAEVTGVDSPGKLKLMRSLGADRVVDYTQENLTKNKDKYDLVIDVVGGKGLRRRLGLVQPGGNYFLAFARLPDLFMKVWLTLSGDRRLRIEAADQEKADLIHLTRLLESGIITPWVDRVYPLEEAAKAHRYAESGEKKGHIALRVQGNTERLVR
jgi:NADPH:quinone reductase-like Zn-dependent oxidoreductase